MRPSPPALLALVLAAAGCAGVRPPLATVPRVDLPRFMGDWHVIAHLPTRIERDAFSAVESYRLDADGTIATTFTFREGSFEGPEKRYRPRGFVKDATGATWGMQFVWPIEAEFLVVHLDEGYRETIIGRTARDYVWIMAREPVLPDADYDRLVERVRGMGYDVSKLRKVPQRPGPRAEGAGPAVTVVTASR